MCLQSGRTASEEAKKEEQTVCLSMFEKHKVYSLTITVQLLMMRLKFGVFALAQNTNS